MQTTASVVFSVLCIYCAQSDVCSNLQTSIEIAIIHFIGYIYIYIYMLSAFVNLEDPDNLLSQMICSVNY